MKTKKAYWDKQEKIRAKTGKLPENAFDFISIHDNTFKPGFSLIAPLCLCNLSVLKCRPDWENDTFSSLKQANRAACFLAACAEKEIGKKIEIVFCPNNQ